MFPIPHLMFRIDLWAMPTVCIYLSRWQINTQIVIEKDTFLIILWAKNHKPGLAKMHMVRHFTYFMFFLSCSETASLHMLKMYSKLCHISTGSIRNWQWHHSFQGHACGINATLSFYQQWMTYSLVVGGETKWAIYADEIFFFIFL